MPNGSTKNLVVVDSCGWLEYLAGGGNADFFESALLDTGRLIVPAVCLYEVGKHMLRHNGEDAALEVLGFMRKAQVVHLSEEQLYRAAKTSLKNQLAMTDALIWQTAFEHRAILLTQDAGLSQMPSVSYIEKRTQPQPRS